MSVGVSVHEGMLSVRSSRVSAWTGSGVASLGRRGATSSRVGRVGVDCETSAIILLRSVKRAMGVGIVGLGMLVVCDAKIGVLGIGCKKKGTPRIEASRYCRCGIVLLEELGGVLAFVDESLDLVDNALAVGCIGYAEPMGCCVEHFDGGSLLVDELVDHERDEELSFQVLHVLGVGEELFEVGFGVLEIVGSEAPNVHGDGCVVGNGDPLSILVLVAYGSVDTHDFSALYDGREVSIGVGGAYAASNGAAF